MFKKGDKVKRISNNPNEKVYIEGEIDSIDFDKKTALLLEKDFVKRETSLSLINLIYKDKDMKISKEKVMSDEVRILLQRARNISSELHRELSEDITEILKKYKAEGQVKVLKTKG